LAVSGVVRPPLFPLAWPIGERQQLVDSAHWMAGDDLGEHVAQIGLRVDTIHFARLCRAPNK
jgi:hypothetical protein